MTPATEMVRPEAVERNAANAPPARTADRTSPSRPGATHAGQQQDAPSRRGAPPGRSGR